MCCSKKLNKRGSFFVEYALILAFVVICGTALLNNNEISLKINNIITSTNELLQKAVNAIVPGDNQTPNNPANPSDSHGNSEWAHEHNKTDHDTTPGNGQNKSAEPQLEVETEGKAEGSGYAGQSESGK